MKQNLKNKREHAKKVAEGEDDLGEEQQEESKEKGSGKAGATT